jgi:hypothetical protein
MKLTATLAVAGVCLALSPAQAEPVQLRYAYSGSPQSNLYTMATAPWA